MKDYLMAIHKDIKGMKEPTYKKIRGYAHTWNNYMTLEGNFITSKYEKYSKNGLWWVSFTATLEGWYVHFFFGGQPTKSWFATVKTLEEAKELGNLFLQNKLVMSSL